MWEDLTNEKVTVFIVLRCICLLGEIDYVKIYKDDYKIEAIRDWFAGSTVVHEKEA